MTNILVLNLFKVHLLSRICHNIVITYMLTEIHSGYDLPFMMHNIVPYVFGGSVKH